MHSFSAIQKEMRGGQ